MYLNGEFQINPPLQGIHFAYLERFGRIRHMKRDVVLLEKLRYPLRKAVGLPLGLDGAYYVAGEIPSEHHPTIIEFNEPPQEQPGLWCFWEPSGDGESYIWRNGDKTYGHSTWLEYLIEHFLKPWNYTLSGRIECSDYFCKYVYPNGEEDEENEVEIQCVDKSELIINDDNIVIDNFLGTFREEQE
jgi:hypothetical protein